MNIAEASRYRDRLERCLRFLRPFPENRFQGRGIVICGGGNYYFPCVWVCIRMLRRVGCRLPIELWYRGPHEMTDEMRALVEPYGVVCQDAFAVSQQFPVHRLDGFEMKPYAIMHNRFAEVLYIDADNVVVRDPEYLFDSALYLQTGSLFWPDVPTHTSLPWYLSEDAWEVMGLSFRHEPQFESGQVVIDKRRCWRPMQLTMHLNEHSDYYYGLFYGDKDTFHVSWRRVGQEYSMIPLPPRVLADHRVLIQFDSAQRALFQHRCNVKWTLARRNSRIAGFLMEEECFALLEELRAKWSGRTRSLPQEYSAAERAVYDEFACSGIVRCSVTGRSACELLFRPDLTLGMSDGLPWNGWRVETDKDSATILVLTDGDRPISFLRRKVEHIWQGYWRFGEHLLVELGHSDSVG